ncbi:hypothetical protein VNO80_26145 [Phaseolus coccineus]|uniref:NAD-dependent epimerase/dehydratase domain-containing protein n=1 Tax=Phaseolus coccineus TaxID=3886 RepID=A0AAN9LVY0_PHACN
MEESKGRVCVTGGTGFIGSWLVKSLLQDGYSVNTTVRHNSVEHRKDVSFLNSLPGASQRHQILSADLNNPEIFGAAIEGCSGVFHVATPVDFELRESEEVVTKRSIDGALGILKACLNSKTVKRVVYTSSASAVIFNGKEEMMDECYWSDVDYLRASKTFGWSYAVSKTLTEKTVLEFGEQNELDVVTLIPTFVFGPFICSKLPSSVYATLNFAFGKKGPFGRYNCSQCLATYERMSELVYAKYPKFQPPNIDSLKQIEGIKIPDLSSKKLIDAGFVFNYGVEKMIDDAIECCQEKGYL